MDDLDDVACMREAAAGNASAFETLVSRYQNVLLNFFLRKGVSSHDGLDLVQGTFLRLWRYRAKYAPSAKFTTFLFMLANQVALDFFRAEGRRRALNDRYAAERCARETAGTMTGAGESSVACRPPDAAACGTAAADGDDVRRALARLAPAMRDVVELGVFQDMPYADVGAVLGIPVGTVKSRMFNALKKLKELLHERRS